EDGHRRRGAGTRPGRLAIQSGEDRTDTILIGQEGWDESGATCGAAFVLRRSINCLDQPRSMRRISGGTPRRNGTMLVPMPPDTIKWRLFSTMWPEAKRAPYSEGAQNGGTNG